MISEQGFRDYIAAFNAGDHASYSAFYAPDVVLRNGGGTELRGAEAITEFYARSRDALDRVMRVEGLICTQHCIAAALASRFIARRDGASFADRVLAKGDIVELRSMALYEIVEDKFAAITATTLHREFLAADHNPNHGGEHG